MQTFTIFAERTSTERHTVNAETFEQALAFFNNGETILKGDEPNGVDSIKIVDQSGKAMTDEEIEAAAVKPKKLPYPVTLQATGSLRFDTQVMATSEEEAMQLAIAELKGFNPYEVVQATSDFTAHVYMPDDVSREDDATEADCRPVGEPFTWEAVQFVQKLAKLQTLKDEFDAMPEGERPDTVGDLDVGGDYAFTQMETLNQLIAEARALLKQPEAPATETEA